MIRIITGLILGLFALFFVFFSSDTLFQLILAGILGYSLFELFKIKGKKNIYVWIIFILVLTNISNLYAHNLFNGGCKTHCVQKGNAINNENKLNNVNDQIDIENENSCLNKFLCRG